MTDAVCCAKVNSAYLCPNDGGTPKVTKGYTSGTSDTEMYEGKHNNDEAWQAELAGHGMMTMMSTTGSMKCMLQQRLHTTRKAYNG